MLIVDNFMHTIRKRTIFLGGFILLALIALPVTLFYSQKEVSTKSNAEKTVDLSYQSSVSSTNSTVQIPAGSTFSLDVYVDPGANSVSLVKLDMTYDPTKFQLAGGFIPNQSVFPQVVEGPISSNGSITATLSIGSNLANAITAKTKVGTLTLKALDNDSSSTATISFGSDSQALSISNNSSYNENVIANTTPVTIQINKPQTSCGTSPGDTMLVMDTSGSMSDQQGSSGTKISNAITAADNFITLVSGQANNRIGLVNFATTAALNSPLTSSFSTVTSQVNALKANGNTCVQCGIDQATQEITKDKRAGVKNAIILLTDGLANTVEGSSKQVGTTTAEQAALTAAANAYKTNGTIFYTIGLGQDVDSAFLTKLAQSTGGQYYFSPTTDQLNTVYSQISQIIEGGSISGTIFSDLTGNGIFDPSDPGIPGVLIQLTQSGSSTLIQSISSSSDGTYSFQNVCNGTYTLSQTLPSGWLQTLPASGNNLSLTMTNGNAVTNENFGDKEITPTPTPTPTPTLVPTATPMPTAVPQPSPSASPSAGTNLSLNVLLHDIGHNGDNVNPTAYSYSNQTPLHPTPNAFAELFDTNNNFIGTASGTITYNDTTGNFIGNVYLNKIITPGNYTVYVGSDYHLVRRIPTIQNLAANKINQMPQIALIAGDVNNDNKLNILDYNLIMFGGCYNDFGPSAAPLVSPTTAPISSTPVSSPAALSIAPSILPSLSQPTTAPSSVPMITPTSCTSQLKTATDLNDDGLVNSDDYNVFLREISVQSGD